MKNVKSSTLALCELIKSNFPKRKIWAVVNLIYKQKTGKIISSTKIPLLFSYDYELVPEFLKEVGVVEAYSKRNWFSQIGESFIDINWNDEELYESNIPKEIWQSQLPLINLTRIAINKGYVNPGECFETFQVIPEEFQGCTVLLDLNKLREFIKASKHQSSLSTPVADNKKYSIDFNLEEIPSLLTINTRPIKIKSSNGARYCDQIINHNKSNKPMEFIDLWKKSGEDVDNYSKKSGRKIYHCLRYINSLIAVKGFENFFNLTMVSVKINKKYLK
jgi:hypothetical protein